MAKFVLVYRGSGPATGGPMMTPAIAGGEAVSGSSAHDDPRTSCRRAPAAGPAAYGDPRDESRRAEFNEKFAAALTVFSENLAAWQLRWSWEQICELRRLCAEHAVAFDPRQYVMADSGMVGGPDRPRPRAAGGTAYVG